MAAGGSSGSSPDRGPTDDSVDGWAAAQAALGRLVRFNQPGRMSLAGAYALGYGQLAVAQFEDEPDSAEWFDDLDPLDTLFLGTAGFGRFADAYQFGNARTAWLRLMRTTRHWRGIQQFVTTVVETSDAHQLPVDEGELMLLVAGRLEDAGLDQRKLPAALLPGRALAEHRFAVGPKIRILPPPPPDALELIARLWAGAQVQLPHDGTTVDALRHGLYLLTIAGLDPHASSALLLPALYLALVDPEVTEELGDRATAWAVGVAEDSPLVPVLDVLLVAGQRDVPVEDALGHLFGVPAFAEPVPDADRRFTSAPGGTLTEIAFELGYRHVDTRAANIHRIDTGTRALLEGRARAFEEKFGRPPGPEDPLFFDPDADEPRPLPPDSVQRATEAILTAAGVSQAWIHATRATDGLLPRSDGTFHTETDRVAWQHAIAEYQQDHPDAPVEDAENLTRLRRMLTANTLKVCAADPAYGQSLARRLASQDAQPGDRPSHRSGDGSGDEELDALTGYLAADAAALAGQLRDPRVTAAAGELARAWGGADLAGRLRDADLDQPNTVDLDVLLVLAVAQLPTGRA